MGVVISNRIFEIPGIVSTSYLEDPSLRLSSQDRRRRKHGEVRALVWHTTGGYPDQEHPTPQRVRPEAAPARALRGRRVEEMWENDTRCAGSHLILDADGSVLCLADLQEEAAYHAGQANEYTIGIEVVQQPDSSLYVAQIAAVPVLGDWLSAAFGLPRRACYPYTGVRNDILEELGSYGHRDCSDNRGAGDPGDFIMRALLDAGWTAF